MAEYKLLLPSMGEGIMEATITTWLKKEGDTIEEEESIVELATDKVDSDLPSPVNGTLFKILKQENEIAQVGEAIAIIETISSLTQQEHINSNIKENTIIVSDAIYTKSDEIIDEIEKPLKSEKLSYSSSDKFLSPLIKSIIKEENITLEELDTIEGTGLDDRITKADILTYLKNRPSAISRKAIEPSHITTNKEEKSTTLLEVPNNNISTLGNEIIEMDRMRKLIADNMLKSKQIAPHVTSFIETDVTNIVHWRNKFKELFLKREGEKLTFTPIFVWAVAQAIKDFPMINISVEGYTIIKKKDINIGIATALPNGNLIVPVILRADQYNISGLAKVINDLVHRARESKLKPHEIQNGTYTISNIGSYGSLMGTPIIPQPQVAILAVGAIQKKPSVVDTPQGDLIGIRHKMYLSHTYDHRVIDGALGGKFLQKVNTYLEHFDNEQVL